MEAGRVQPAWPGNGLARGQVMGDEAWSSPSLVSLPKDGPMEKQKGHWTAIDVDILTFR